jgi:LssY C-terminus
VRGACLPPAIHVVARLLHVVTKEAADRPKYNRVPSLILARYRPCDRVSPQLCPLERARVKEGLCVAREHGRATGEHTVRSLTRLLQRLLIVGLGAATVWLIVFVVFGFADHRLPWIVALGVTYACAAYVILPRAVRMGLKILHRKRIPRFTVTGDGLPGDPVNVALIGTLQQLRSTFAVAGWSEADRLGLVNSWRMARAFVLNSPYPTAPFSTLYLFGRGQDIGFQKSIDNSPRKRHHIRFWALSLAHAEGAVGTTAFWINADRPPNDARVLWVGAGTRDTGFSLTRLTFQITHATDADTNAERDYIVSELGRTRLIGDVTSYQSGHHLAVGHFQHYVTDGNVSVADLLIEAV